MWEDKTHAVGLYAALAAAKKLERAPPFAAAHAETILTVSVCVQRLFAVEESGFTVPMDAGRCRGRSVGHCRRGGGGMEIRLAEVSHSSHTLAGCDSMRP